MNSSGEVGQRELPSDSGLTAAAVAGDRVALERLLLAHYDELARRIDLKLPLRLQSTQAVEDILQLTFFQAFRDIAHFQQRTERDLWRLGWRGSPRTGSATPSGSTIVPSMAAAARDRASPRVAPFCKPLSSRADFPPTFENPAPEASSTQESC